MVVVPCPPVTKEDPSSGMHLVMFDEEMDDAALEENMRAVEAGAYTRPLFCST